MAVFVLKFAIAPSVVGKIAFKGVVQDMYSVISKTPSLSSSMSFISNTPSPSVSLQAAMLLLIANGSYFEV